MRWRRRDGPTHQPVEQILSMRAIPGLVTLRPRRCQRSGRGLPLHHAVAPSAGGVGVVAPPCQPWIGEGTQPPLALRTVLTSRRRSGFGPGSHPLLRRVVKSVLRYMPMKVLAEGIRSRSRFDALMGYF